MLASLTAGTDPPTHDELILQANGQCCEDNADAACHHELLLPGHLLLKFMKEQIDSSLDVLVQQVSMVLVLSWRLLMTMDAS